MIYLLNKSSLILIKGDILTLTILLADPAKCIKGGANFEIFSVHGRVGDIASSAPRQSHLQKYICNGGAPGAPLYRSYTAYLICV